MSGLSFAEMEVELNKMMRVLKAFEKLDEVVRVATLHEQLVSERTKQLQRLDQEILDLKKSKEKLSQEITEEISHARQMAEKAIGDYKQSEEWHLEKSKLLSEDYEQKMISLSEEFEESRAEYGAENKRLLEEIARNSTLLESIKKQIATLRSKLE